MSIASVTDMFRVAPSHPGSTPGTMSLAGHLRELRARLIRSALVLVVAFGVSLLFFDPLLALVLGPYNQARDLVGADTTTSAYVAGATGPLMLHLKLSGVAALMAASPYWLWQAWAFVVPGLLEREGGGRASSRWSPVPCSSGAWPWVTTCSPRASAC